jgi:predicted small secreted protein
MNTLMKAFLIIGMATVILGAASCNTVHGVGHDVRNVGTGIESVAR